MADFSMISRHICVEVAVPIPAMPPTLSYVWPASFEQAPVIGARVRVSVRNRSYIGVIISVQSNDESPSTKLKAVLDLIDSAALVSTKQLELSQFVADYYHAHFGETVALCLPPSSKALKAFQALASEKAKSSEARLHPLTSEQQEAFQTIRDSNSGAFLLEGVTGSGKTEVYLHLVDHVLRRGQSALVIVPEIALTPQLYDRFSQALCQPIAILHSKVSPAKRREAIFALARGEIRVAIGARSAVFAPMPNLGLIVVDEEHDASFKQEISPRYNARDVALWRANHEGATIVLGSATPSLESRRIAASKRLTHLHLAKRYGDDTQMPEFQIMDLRLQKSLCILSPPLEKAIAETLAAKQQVILFLNRRGYAAFALCDHCGHILECTQCSVSLTYYQATQTLRCHQCEYQTPLPLACPECHHGPLLCLGFGTERVEQEVLSRFPDARVARIDRDAMKSQDHLEDILRKMTVGEIDILIGTQMITKGHHFPAVTLVGIILADVALALPDFRAAERAFQVITQAGGRSGRTEHKGRVLIQTFNPNHPAIQYACRHDVKGFAEQEESERRTHGYPPYSRLTLLRIEGVSQTGSSEGAEAVRHVLQQAASDYVKTPVRILGPAPATFERLRGKYRFHIFLFTPSHAVRQEILGYLESHPTLFANLRKKKCRLVIDVDPIALM